MDVEGRDHSGALVARRAASCGSSQRGRRVYRVRGGGRGQREPNRTDIRSVFQPTVPSFLPTISSPAILHTSLSLLPVRLFELLAPDCSPTAYRAVAKDLSLFLRSASCNSAHSDT